MILVYSCFKKMHLVSFGDFKADFLYRFINCRTEYYFPVFCRTYVIIQYHRYTVCFAYVLAFRHTLTISFFRRKRRGIIPGEIKKYF